MSLRVVFVSAPAVLKLLDNALLVEKPGGGAGKVPVEDMAVLILDGDEIELDHALLAQCVSKGVAVVVCDAKHLPSGLLLPLAGHSLHTSTLRDQIAAGVPAMKRTWQSIVRAKLHAQADMLRHADRDHEYIRRMISLVRSGDPDNIEATAAARYFEALFGEEFYRAREVDGINSVLNYGYAIVRAIVARALVGAGLHPALGVHHRNQYNPFCLADDAMEPIRPMVDRIAWELIQVDAVPDELYPQVKRKIIGALSGFVRFDGKRYPLLVGVERYAASLRRAICEGEDLIAPIPDPSP